MNVKVFWALLLMLGGLVLSLGTAPAGGKKEEPPKGEDVKHAKALYDDPKIFSQLSGMRQSALENRFGKKKTKAQPSTGAGFKEFFPFAKCPANVLVNDPKEDTTIQDTQSETALVLGAQGHVISAFNDSGLYRKNGSNLHLTGWSLSSNGGMSFTDKGSLPGSDFGIDQGDPVLARSAKTGTIFLSTLSTNDADLLVFRSTNNGASFQAPVNAAPGFTTANGAQDKEWIAVDNFPIKGVKGEVEVQGNVYMFWRNFALAGGMTFTRSTDDGKTWTPKGGQHIDKGKGQGAFVTVGKDHSVYLFWGEYIDDTRNPRILMAKSTNLGVSFGAPVTVVNLRGVGAPNGDLGLGGFRTNSFCQAAVNPANGHLYVVYNDKGINGGDRGDIFLTESSNGGKTWAGSPVKLNDDVTTHDQWQPSIAVTPDGKHVAVTWYDRRVDPKNTLIDRFGVIGKVAGTTPPAFGKNFRITCQSFPAVFGVDPVINATYMGDYDQMDADNAFFYTTWGDNRDQSIAVPTRKNANVRFAKIPVTYP